MKLKFIKEVFVGGQKVSTGAVLDLATGEANLLLGMGKAELAIEFDIDGEEDFPSCPPQLPPKPPARKKAPPKAE
tara:strand:+ start:7225 stop:7449 length:225 start_codon:yes stop_codon:yes gene_type:complete